ncbi:hypothetical protein [Flavobacterium sp.]|uniref:hypothetical protein n=1 Tax=Flavobacterium sp. TaxID=239 RepID=UPI004033BFF1
MKLYEFLILSEELQYQTVWERGVHVDNIVYDRIHHQLYAINDFFVEIHYSVSDNKIIGKLAFKGGEPLDKYLMPLPF